jgi:hypothetical protein
MNKVIIIAQRGWAFAGDMTREGSEVNLSNASCIRRWGTTKGIGQLAIDGPQSDTILDPVGEIKFHELAIVCCITIQKPELWVK